MTYALYELALNQTVQDRLRREINDVIERHNGKITYDGLMEMTYLDQVVYGEYWKHETIQSIYATKKISMSHSSSHNILNDIVFLIHASLPFFLFTFCPFRDDAHASSCRNASSSHQQGLYSS